MSKLNTLKYKELDVKYQIEELYTYYTDIVGYSCDSEHIKLSTDGKLTIERAWLWDGASGPTIDSPYTMQPCLEHDAFYYLIRQGLLPFKLRDSIDEFMRKRLVMCGYYDIEVLDKSTGFLKWFKTKLRKRGVRKRAGAWEFFVDIFGSSSASEKEKVKVITLNYP